MSKREWRWVGESVVWAIHEQQLAEHGGPVGIRDHGLVLSALARPQNLVSYGKSDAADLAAAYAWGICRNHGFLDGNKRTAFVVAIVFLLDNSYELTATDQEATTAMLSVAEGMMTEAELGAWFRAQIRKLPVVPVQD